MTRTPYNESEPEMARTALPEWVKDQLAVREAEEMAANRTAYDEWAARVAADIAWMISTRYDSR